jgi:hypothetical protein
VNWLSSLFGLFNGASATIGTVTVTPSQMATLVDQAIGSFTGLAAAVKAHDWGDAADLTVEDILKVLSQPEFAVLEGPFVLPIDVMALLLPTLIQQGSKHLGQHAPIFPSANSPNDKTNGIWPTTIGNNK